jgi:hypothetical protein
LTKTVLAKQIFLFKQTFNISTNEMFRFTSQF